MFLHVLDALHDHASERAAAPLYGLDSAVRHRLVEESDIKHAQFHAFGSVLAVAAARAARKLVPANVRSVGVVVCGGMHHARVAWEFTRVALDRGPRFVEPLRFPHTLLSALPTTAAAAIGAHGLAITVGTDEAAYLQGLRFSAGAISAGLAEAIILLAVADYDELAVAAGRHAALPIEAISCGLATVISPTHFPGAQMRLESMSRRPKVAGPCCAEIDAVASYDLSVSETGATAANFATFLNGRAIGAPTAAVALFAAHQAMRSSHESPGRQLHLRCRLPSGIHDFRSSLI